MRFNYLFWLANWGRCIQSLVLEIRGEKVFGIRVATYRFKTEGYIALFVC
jgi:hypothetical protein